MTDVFGRELVYCTTCGKRIRRQYLGPEGWKNLEPIEGRERWQCPRCQLQGQ